MSAASTTKPRAAELASPSRHDWSAFEAMTEAEREAAALADPDARPMTETEWARAKRVPQVTTLRRRLGLTLEEFSQQYRIPIVTLQDWEAGRSAPDPVGQAYLQVIGRLPEVLRQALE
jgi:putative transcriptional regulator